MENQKGENMNKMRRKMNIKDLSSKDPKVKYSCAKSLLDIARDNPIELYPNFDYFAELLDSDNQILKWTAIDIIGHMSKVDGEKKVDKLMGKLFELLNTGKLITAAHAISALTDIAVAKPEYQRKITEELLKVENYIYDTVECRNIALGKVILAISRYSEQLEDKAVIEFLLRQTKNTRNATKKKAEQFLKKLKSEKNSS